VNVPITLVGYEQWLQERLDISVKSIGWPEIPVREKKGGGGPERCKELAEE
jgi:hypothetical protein